MLPRWSHDGQMTHNHCSIRVINILRVAERVIHPRFASEKLKVNHFKANTKIN